MIRCRACLRRRGRRRSVEGLYCSPLFSCIDIAFQAYTHVYIHDIGTFHPVKTSMQDLTQSLRQEIHLA